MEVSSRYTLVFRTITQAIIGFATTLLLKHGIKLSVQQSLIAYGVLLSAITGLWNLAEAKGWLKWLKYLNLSIQQAPAGSVPATEDVLTTPDSAVE